MLVTSISSPFRHLNIQYKVTEVDRPEWSGTRPEVETSVTAMDTMVTLLLWPMARLSS